MLPRLLAATTAVGLLVACAGTHDPSSSDGVSEADVVAGGLAAAPDDPCRATLVFLQKDAYKSGGRTSELWPPHTTTVLEVTCTTRDGERMIAPFQANHGTKPGTKDADGNEVLARVEMDPRVVTTEAPWRQMRELVASFASCECEPGGFLSLDQVGVEAAGILERLLAIATCADPDAAILAAAREKRFTDLGRMVQKCRVREGVGPGELGDAAAAVAADVRSVHEGHHVCNNDAVLQADLFKRFRESRDASACSAKAKACSGPKLFFQPRREVD